MRRTSIIRYLWGVLAVFTLLATSIPAQAGTQATALLNEIGVNPPSTDNPYEYIEIISSSPSTSLAGYYFVAFEGDFSGAATGTADMVVNLSAVSTGSNGLLMVKNTTGGHTAAVGTTVVTDAQLNSSGGGIENGTNSYMLIHSPTNAIVEATDYDTNEDGTLELPNGATVVDTFAWTDGSSASDIMYGGVVLTQSSGTPDAATRFPGNSTVGVAAWYNGDLAGATNDSVAYSPTQASTNFPVGGALTPGATNVPVADAAPTVTSTLPTNLANGIATNTTITLNFSESVDVANGSVTLTCDSAPVALTGFANDVTSVVLTPDTALSAGASCAVNVSALGVSDNDGVVNTLAVDYNFSFVVASGTPPVLTIPNFTVSGVSGVSGVIGATNPTHVIPFTVSDTETNAIDLTVSRNSSNTSVLPNANAVLSAVDASMGQWQITISGPGTTVGYSNLTVSVGDGSNTTTFDIRYAASQDIAPLGGLYLTGASDASSAIALDANFMVVSDDEDQIVRVYPRTTPISEGFAASTNFTPTNGAGDAPLALTDISGGIPREVDLEGSTRNGNSFYWLGSQSNSSGGSNRPNRSRVFGATWNAQTGANATFTFDDRYDFLEADLLAWDSGNGHGAGANFLGLTASANAGVVPEATNGFNIEGFSFAPASTTTTYVGFRAPLVNPVTGTTNRTHALIVPVNNLDASLTPSGGTSGSLVFGAPIYLDLGGRGIRSIECNANGCLIVAGSSDATSNFRLYTWSGNPLEAPQERIANLAGLNPESIVELPATFDASATVQLISDNGDNIWYGDAIISKDLLETRHQKFRVHTVTLGAVFEPTRIRTIQGASHVSPLNGQGVVNVQGIVTAKRSNGFYLQDPQADANNATSEGIFVFTGSGNALLTARTVGEAVLVSGTVKEFRPGFAGNPASCTFTTVTPPGNCTGPGLSITEIVNDASVQTLAVSAWTCSGVCTITPVVVGTGGRIVPNLTLQSETNGTNIETAGAFNADTDGADFYESLEHMVVQLTANARVVGATASFSSGQEVWVVGDNFANSNNTPNARGGITVTASDLFNPERIRVSTKTGTNAMGGTLPDLNVGGTFTGTINGIFDYSFHNYELISTQTSYTSTQSTITPEVTTLTSGATNQLTVATFNVENLGADENQAAFDARAVFVVNNLLSPDIIVIEEIQDNNGATNDSVVDATTTFNTLISRIAALGGPTYSFRQINPVDDQNGGEPGGNIRVGFLYNASHVTFVDVVGGTSTTANAVVCNAGDAALQFSPGLIAPTNSAFNSSRKPIVGQFTFNGETIFVVGNHWNSKGGDDPIFGVNYPPVLSSEVQRTQQATLVRDFVQDLLTCDNTANVIVAGDLNDFQFAPPVTTLIGTTPALTPLNTLLAEPERYGYVYQGTTQTLDHIVVSPNLLNNAEGGFSAEYDGVHVNAEFVVQASDHDPSIARFTFNPPVVTPVITITAINPNASEGASSTSLFRINNSGASSVTVTANLGGDAIYETDYTYSFGNGTITNGVYTLLLAPGDNDVLVDNIIDDVLPETAETITLTLNAGVGYTLGNTTTDTITITDNDVEAVVTFNPATALEVGEDAGSVNLPIELVVTGGGTLPSPVTVTLAYTGTADANDYTAPATFDLVNVGGFTAGTYTGTLVVNIIDDTLFEDSGETLITTLSTTAQNVTVGVANTRTVTVTNVDVPHAPVLVAPMGVINDNTPAFVWNHIPGVEAYQLFVNAGGPDIINQWHFSVNICSQGVCSIPDNYGPYLAPANYQWFVRGWDSVLAEGTWTSAQPFTVNPAPMTAFIAPLGSTDNTMPHFKWQHTPGVEWYYLWVSDGVNPIHAVWHNSALICSLGVCSVDTASTFTNGQTYSWWVQTWANGVYGNWSAEQQFTPTASIAPVQLVAPLGSFGLSTAPTFTWTHHNAVTWYQIWVSDGANTVYSQWYELSQTVGLCNATTCSVTPNITLTANQTYYWWVQNYTTEMGPWSAQGTFTFQLSAPVAISPLNIGIAGLNPILNWSRVNGATDYQVWISDGVNTVLNATYNESQLFCNGSVCYLSTTLDLPVGNYQWWVRGYNATLGDGPWSIENRFSVVAP